MGGRRILINALGIAQGGGSRSYFTNVLGELARDDRGFRFVVLAQPRQLDDIDTRGVDVEIVRFPRIPGIKDVVGRVLFEETLLPFRARAFDLLYCQGDLAPCFSRTPTVVLLRNLNIYDRRWYDDLRTRTLARLVRWGLPHARRILFPTHAAARLVSKRMPVPQDRITVVPYGISLQAFEAGEAAAARSRYLFLPAAIERHKNIAVLIESLRHVGDPGLEVWIAGISLLDPGHQVDLERRAEQLGVRDRVRFLGLVPYEEMLRYYRGAAALVFPSLIESFGHPLLEAMAAGTPVVASDIPTFREIAGDAVLYFPPEDPVALARSVDQLLTDANAIRRRVERGRERAAEYSWKVSVDRLCAVFDEVLRAG